MDSARVVVLGAGFGGLWAARALRDPALSVLVIDRHNFHTFLPLLYQVGAAELEPFSIARPVRTLLRRRHAEFLHATVRRLDPARKVVYTDRGIHAYDYLIVATGSVAHDFGVEGARDHAFPLKTLEDGIALRTRVLERFEAATHEPDAAGRRRRLRFLVIGGGPTGVEYAGALSELIRGPLARDYPHVALEASVLVLEAGERLLPGLPEKLGRYALERLEGMGVEVLLRSAVTRVTAAGLVLEGADGERREVDGETVAWTAGVRGASDPDWGLPVGSDGRIEVDETLRVRGHPDAFAVGDVARVVGAERALPQLAQVAMQGGEHAARSIERLRRGEDVEPFRYRDKGIMAVIGRNAAVAWIRGRCFTGFLAWLLWLGIHLVYLIGFRNRLAVLLNWGWDYVFLERAARILIPLRITGPRWPERWEGEDPPRG